MLIISLTPISHLFNPVEVRRELSVQQFSALDLLHLHLHSSDIQLCLTHHACPFEPGGKLADFLMGRETKRYMKGTFVDLVLHLTGALHLLDELSAVVIPIDTEERIFAKLALMVRLGLKAAGEEVVGADRRYFLGRDDLADGRNRTGEEFAHGVQDQVIAFVLLGRDQNSGTHHPRVFPYFMDVRPLSCLLLHHTFNKIPNSHRNVLRALEGISLNYPVQALSVLFLIGQVACCHCMQSHSKRPDVNLAGIILAAVEHFGRGIAWGSTRGLEEAGGAQLFAESEVNQFKVAFRVDDDIFGLDVPVADPLLVQVPHCRYQLIEVAAAFCRTQLLALHDHLVQLDSFHQFGHDVQVRGGLVQLQQFQDVGVVDFLQDGQLLLDPGQIISTGDPGFLEDLDGDLFAGGEMQPLLDLAEGAGADGVAELEVPYFFLEAGHGDQ